MFDSRPPDKARRSNSSAKDLSIRDHGVRDRSLRGIRNDKDMRKEEVGEIGFDFQAPRRIRDDRRSGSAFQRNTADPVMTVCRFLTHYRGKRRFYFHPF